MKRKSIYLVIFILCGFMMTSLKAQEIENVDSVSISGHNSDFHFVYIDHEPSTPIGELCRRLSKLYNDALETGSKCIVYLANEDQPIISFTNMEDPSPDAHRDSLEFFYTIIDELQSRSYNDVSSSVDVDSIKNLIGFGGFYPIFDESSGIKSMRYNSVTLDFYVGKRFWALHHNESIIANLFQSLQMPAYMHLFPITELSFNVYKPENDKLEYPQGQPFGFQNLGGINETINILEY